MLRIPDMETSLNWMSSDIPRKQKTGMPLAPTVRGIPLNVYSSRTAKLHYCAIHNLSCMMYFVLEYRSYPLHPFSSVLQPGKIRLQPTTTY